MTRYETVLSTPIGDESTALVSKVSAQDKYPECRVRLKRYRDGRGLRLVVRRPVESE